MVKVAPVLPIARHTHQLHEWHAIHLFWECFNVLFQLQKYLSIYYSKTCLFAVNLYICH